MLDPDDLLKLALAYREATGFSLSRISRMVAGNNDKVFGRLSAGQSINASTAQTVERYFRENWPENAIWPLGVAGKPRKTVPPVINRRNKPQLIPERNCGTA